MDQNDLWCRHRLPRCYFPSLIRNCWINTVPSTSLLSSSISKLIKRPPLSTIANKCTSIVQRLGVSILYLTNLTYMQFRRLGGVSSYITVRYPNVATITDSSKRSRLPHNHPLRNSLYHSSTAIHGIFLPTPASPLSTREKSSSQRKNRPSPSTPTAYWTKRGREHRYAPS